MKSIGIDDYLQGHSLDQFLALEEVLGGAYLQLSELNFRFAFVPFMNGFYSFDHKVLLKKEAFKDLIKPIKYTFENPNGGIKQEKILEHWLSWAHKRVCTAMVYSPGKEQAIGSDTINLWRSPNIKPVRQPKAKSKLYLYHGLLEQISPDSTNRKFLEQALCYPIKYPGEKLYFAVVVHGAKQGTGKSLLGLVFSYQYGPSNSYQIGHDTVVNVGGFNPWARAQFLIVEEAAAIGYQKKRELSLLKQLITDKTIYLNQKNQPEQVIDNHLNLYLTSNESNALHITDQDRRFFVIDVTNPPMEPTLGQEINDWASSEVGKSELLHYIQNNVDFVGFNPHGRPPVTAALTEMVDLAKSDIENFVELLLQSPNALAQQLMGTDAPPRFEIMTNNDICEIARAYIGPKNNITPRSIGLALRKCGVFCARSNTRYWVLQNVEHWRKQTLKAVAARYKEINTLGVDDAASTAKY